MPIVPDGQLQGAADHALTHSAAHVKGQAGGDGLCGLVLEDDPADLRPVPVGQGHRIPLLDDVHNMLRSLADDLQVRLCGGRHAAILEGVSAQGNDDSFHFDVLLATQYRTAACAGTIMPRSVLQSNPHVVYKRMITDGVGACPGLHRQKESGGP